MTLVRWNPVRELASMEIDRLNNMFEDLYGTRRTWAPAVDIYETEGHEYVIKAELPDLKREHISVTFENNVLTLSGERTAEFENDNGTWHRSERFHGKFTRSFTIPMQIDPTKVEAKFQNGVLELVLPKAENVKPRSIKINATAK